MATLEDYLRMLQTDPEQMKRAQIAGLLGGMGQGLLSAPGMRGVANMGYGGFQGAQDARANAQNEGLAKLKNLSLAQQMASSDMDYQTKQRDFNDENTARDTLKNFSMPSPLSSMAPTPQNAQALASAPKPGIYEKLIAQAEALESKGLVKQATQYRALAEKYAPSVHGESTGTDAQGNRVRYVTMKDGSTKVLPVGPDKEKLAFQDAGGQILPLDPFTGRPVAPGIGKTATPGELLSNEVARGNLDVNRGQLSLERDKFGYTKQRDAAGPKGERPSDQQLAAQGFLSRMQNAGGIVDDIEVNKGYTPSFGQAYAESMKQLPVIGPTAGGLANMAVGAAAPNAQPYQQAQADWVRAKLRKESGAVIGPEEMASEIRTYFPQAGDSDAVIKQKRASRKQAERQMAIMAGTEKFADRATDLPDPLGLRK